MKNMKKYVSVMLTIMLVAASMCGCQKNSDSQSVSVTPDGELGSFEVGQSGLDESSDEAAELVPLSSQGQNILDFVKSNFAAAGSQNEAYQQPLYDLSEDYVFTFECSEEAGMCANEAFEVYDNPKFEEITGKTYHKCEYENGKLIVKPEHALYLDENGSKSVSDGTWGSMNQLYLVQHIDLTTGEKLEKPLVTPFTIKHDVPAPQIWQEVDENNSYVLRWNEVPGAVEYRVYECFGDVAYKIQCSTLGTSVSVEDFADQKESEELLALFEKDLQEAGYYTGSVHTDGIAYMNSAVKPNEELADGYYVVVAVDAQGRQSGVSNIVDVRDIAYKLPYKVADSVVEVEISSVEDIPSHVEVEMLDGSVQTMIINFNGARVAKYEDAKKVTIEAGVANTLFDSFILSLHGMTYDDVRAGAPYIKERQAELLSKVGGAMPSQVKVDMDADEETEEPEIEEPEIEEPEIEEPETEQPQTAEGSSAPVQLMNEVASHVETTMEALGSENVEQVLYGSNDLGAWMGMCLIAQSEVIPAPIEVFPDAANIDYAAQLLMESFRQNPTSGFLCNVGYSKEKQAFAVEYLEDSQVRLSKTKQEIDAAKNIADSVVTEGMSDYEKVLAINEYFRNNATYDFDSTETEIEDYSILSEQFIDSHTPYGIICNNYGVCESYSEAFILTARFAGLEAMCETGTLYGGGHEWNRVKVDDSWCVLDVTNNDAETCVNGLLNVTDDQIQGILIPDDIAITNADSYAASDETKEYYYMTGKVVADLSAAADLLEEQLDSADTAFLRVPADVDQSELEEVIRQLVQEKGIRLTGAGTQFNILCVEK